jgi:geranylgeranyl pyrophosphate synthase
VDNETERKGQKSCDEVFGKTSVLLSSMYNFSRIQQDIALLSPNDPNMMNFYADLLKDLYRAEHYDHHWRSSYKHDNYLPTEFEITENHMLKNAKYFLLPFKVQQANCLNNESDFSYLANLLAVFTQHRDDYENLFMPESHYKDRETFAGDLDGSRFTLPIIFSLSVNNNQEFCGKF